MSGDSLGSHNCGEGCDWHPGCRGQACRPTPPQGTGQLHTTVFCFKTATLPEVRNIKVKVQRGWELRGQLEPVSVSHSLQLPCVGTHGSCWCPLPRSQACPGPRTWSISEEAGHLGRSCRLPPHAAGELAGEQQCPQTAPRMGPCTTLQVFRLLLHCQLPKLRLKSSWPTPAWSRMRREALWNVVPA